MPQYFTQYGQKKVSHDGYVYHQPHESEYFSLWKCEDNDCEARAKILNGQTVQRITLLAVHNHLPSADIPPPPPPPPLLKVEPSPIDYQQQFDLLFGNQQLNNPLVYYQQEGSPPQQVPSFIDYHTDFEFDHPESPTPSENDLILERERLPSSDSFKEEEIKKPLDQYSKINGGESFLKHDTGTDDPDRILFFTSQKNLDILKTSDYWGINCVIKKIPKPFIRCWVIHGFHQLKAFPLAFFLVRSNNESTFERSMKLLPEGTFPKHVMMEYKLKEYKLAQTLFPDATFHLCYFYFTGHLMRKIANYHWIHRYRNDQQFHIDVKCFMMLAFVKPVDVVRYFNVLKETFNEIYQDSANLTGFYAYMEDEWIGNPELEKSPTYPIELWNVYDSTINHFSRTNNFFKTWLSRYYARFRLNTFWADEEVTVYSFINAILNGQNFNDFTLEQMTHGIELPHFRKNNMDIFQVVQNYDNYEPLNYLRAVSTASLSPPKSEHPARNGNSPKNRKRSASKSESSGNN